MISFIEGTIKKILSNPKRLIVLVGGIGYEILTPEFLSSYFIDNDISINSSIKLEIYYHVTESQPKPLLVGFINESEKEFFEQLIQVEGIGPVKAANSLIHPINIIANAIETEDYDILEQMPGIGKRAAQKIVATLKGKVLDKISNESVILETSISENSVFKDALGVLVDLGYRVSDARTQINEVMNSTESDEDVNVENLLREVFKRAR